MIHTNDACEVVLLRHSDNEAEWLAERHKGLSGSDCLAALGHDPYTSRFALWCQKRAAEPPTVPETPRMRMGRLVEPIVMVEFEYQTGLRVEPWPVLLRSREWPWMLASPDGAIVTEDDGMSLYEGKSTSFFRKSDWADGETPIRVQAQVAHYLAVTGLSVGYVAVLIDNEVHWRRIDRDDNLIRTVVEQEREFWQLVESGQPPQVDASPSTTDALLTLYPDHVEGRLQELDQVTHDVYLDLISTKAELSLLEAREKALSNRLREAIGDAEYATWGGKPIVSYKSHTRRSLDTKALAQAHPGIVAEFTSEKPVRTLRMLKAGE